MPVKNNNTFMFINDTGNIPLVQATSPSKPVTPPFILSLLRRPSSSSTLSASAPSSPSASSVPSAPSSASPSAQSASSALSSPSFSSALSSSTLSSSPSFSSARSSPPSAPSVTYFDTTKCYKKFGSKINSNKNTNEEGYLGKYKRTVRCPKEGRNNGYMNIFSLDNGPCRDTNVFNSNGIYPFMKTVPLYIEEVTCKPCDTTNYSSCSVQGGRRRKTNHRKTRRRRTIRRSR